jgi:hypothetical protein
MLGKQTSQNALFQYFRLEDVIPEKHHAASSSSSGRLLLHLSLGGTTPHEKRTSFHRFRGRLTGNGAGLPL